MRNRKQVDLSKMVESISLFVKMKELVSIDAKQEKQDFEYKKGELGQRLFFRGNKVCYSNCTTELPDIGVKFKSPVDVAWYAAYNTEGKIVGGEVLAVAEAVPTFNYFGL